jgi:hypothetical protein
MDRPRSDLFFDEAVIAGPEAISLSHASGDWEAIDSGHHYLNH